MNPFYREYVDFLAEHFDGKVQKLSIDLSLSCPNRDGRLGVGGCIYCNNEAFSPDADKRGLSVKEQLERGKIFFSRKYSEMKYLAYFQSYTSTYAAYSTLINAYNEALCDKDVVGIVISTRPDCIPDDLIALLKKLKDESSKKIFIELGVESLHNKTLTRINRRHTAEAACDAIQRCALSGFPVGVHLILGLPGEDEDMMTETIKGISALPVSTVKFHQLQILSGTPLATLDCQGQLKDMLRFNAEEYARLCARLLKHLRKDIAVDRFVAQAPDNLLLSPRWGLKNYQFTYLLQRILANNVD
ncbi:MAG: TIGR01212 family radical SAM protein [Muribaculaceae bacterium]|nr:TIGR01212 family radical SAM protein [Muribaculaceae bacterium]